MPEGPLAGRRTPVRWPGPSPGVVPCPSPPVAASAICPRPGGDLLRMLPPNCRNPEASGSQTGPPSQDSGGSPDRSQSQMALALTQDSQTTVTQSPPPHCCTWDKACGLGVWEMPRIFSSPFVLDCRQAQCLLWTSVSQPRKWGSTSRGSNSTPPVPAGPELL